ncbi:MAG TPA: hypothetical protein ENL34_11130 [Chloroflexi bacterium]|nr:hypothetical protein [Chloroflexota bacterium]
MPDSIQFDTIIDQLTPDVQVETDWESGSTGLPNDKKTLLLMGQGLASGSVGVPTGSDVQTPQRITSVAKAISLFGKGSNLAVMCEYAIKAGPRATIYAVQIKAGTTPGQATIDLVLASNATGSGELRVHIMGERFAVGVASGDTPTDIGDLIEAAINGHPNLPVTASNAAGTVTLNHRVLGLEGNSIATRAEITASGMTATMGGASLASGTVAADPTTQLAAMLADRYHLIAAECSDATALGLIQAHQEAASTPAEKRWGLGIAAVVDTAANAQTLGNGLDSYRMQVLWQEASERPAYALAATLAGLRASNGPKKAFDNVVLPNVPTPYDEDAWPNVGDIETALEEGLIPLRAKRGSGKCEIVRSVVTRQTTPITYRDHNIPEKSDYTDLAVITGLTPYVGKTLKVDSPPGQPGTVTPNRVKATLGRILKALDREDILQGVATAIGEGRVFAKVNNTTVTRVDCAYPFKPTQNAHTIMCKKTYETTASL